MWGLCVPVAQRAEAGGTGYIQQNFPVKNQLPVQTGLLQLWTPVAKSSFKKTQGVSICVEL